MSWRACAHRHRECHCHSLTLQKVLRSRLVIGWCRQLASCVLSLARRGSYGSGAFACIGVTNVCLCVRFALLVAWHGCGMRPALRCVCAWASLDCKCLFASVGEALALACCVGMGRCMRGEGRVG